jgi:hypothetical protein
MLNAIKNILRDLASFNNGEDGDEQHADDENAELLNLSEDIEPSGVIDTISIILHHLMERFRQKQMKRDKLTQPG